MPLGGHGKAEERRNGMGGHPPYLKNTKRAYGEIL